MDTFLPGSKWRNTHQATVNSVLTSDPKSPLYRKVESKGGTFYNRDTWFARTFIQAFTEWGRLNRENANHLDAWTVQHWLSTSTRKAFYNSERGITIAATPDELPRSLAMALVGGGYHEAWHTVYSRRTPITFDEVYPRITNLWEKIPWAPEKGYRGWSKLMDQLLQWSNIIEDIRIERIGTKEFPGSQEKMEALQNLILKMETDSFKNEPGWNFGVLAATFRDLGLGYNTSAQMKALEKYECISPESFRLVKKGALRPILDRAIKLGKGDDMDCLWLAMEVMIVLADLSAPAAAAAYAAAHAPPKEEVSQKEEGEKKDQSKPQKEKNQSKPQKIDQVDATPDEDEGEALPKEEGSQSYYTEKPPLFKVGDRVEIQEGPYAGRLAQVVRADLPDPITGEQNLQYALLEEVSPA